MSGRQPTPCGAPVGEQGMIAAKFGGSSLADAAQFKQVRSIVRADSRRAYIIPSAPGKRFDGDDKITDLLYQCQALRAAGQPFDTPFAAICARYIEISAALHLTVDLAGALGEVQRAIAAGAGADYCASRGEYLCGRLLADFLGLPFVDPQGCIFFDENGLLLAQRTNDALAEALQGLPGAVIPGFYGSGPDGAVRTFSRGGSDITGALVARAVRAEVYENWTDVSGFLMADPRVVQDPQPIRHITYHEMHELSRAGATVLHEDSVFPVSRAGIPTNIRNTNAPQHPGTMITCTAVQREDFAIFAGIAGKRGFSLLLAEKDEPGNSPALLQQVFCAVNSCSLRFDYLPTGLNNICLLAETAALAPVLGRLQQQIDAIEIPHHFSVQQHIALLILVGYGVRHTRTSVARIYEALRRAEIGVHILNQGSGELSTWVGVGEADLENAIRAIYAEFAVTKLPPQQV